MTLSSVSMVTSDSSLDHGAREDRNRGVGTVEEKRREEKKRGERRREERRRRDAERRGEMRRGEEWSRRGEE